ncbi:unannotated protein [freshwater metagenome]|uniref:Unannotated protein n=1 Tax=freshwater metagenome TaxID=449393 RepID=A0A6J6JIT5_9ZZZZ
MEMVVDPNRVKAKLFCKNCDLDGFVPLCFGTFDTGQFHFPSLWDENTEDWRVGIVGHCPSFVAEVIVLRCPSFPPQS